MRRAKKKKHTVLRLVAGTAFVTVLSLLFIVFEPTATQNIVGNKLQQSRGSSVQKLTPHTVASLRLAASVTLPGAKGYNESVPVEQHGILYVTTSQDRVFAMNATNGRILWSYTPVLHNDQYLPHINRGVALGQHLVYLLTTDDRLIALQKSTGRPVFSVRVANPALGYFESMAPALAGPDVIVGSAGGDEGMRGFVAAYNALTGKFAWRFYTVPARGQGWMPANGFHGGGAVWTTPTYDPQTGTVYFGTGNPSPDFYGKMRPGPDPYTDSVIAMNALTGRMQWARQEVPHDLWDYDVASPPVLFSLHGQKIVGEAGKDGYWYEWNAVTGKPLTTPVAFVRERHSPPTAAGVTEWPGPEGGANYGPSAYDPQTGCAYVAGINGSEVVSGAPQHHLPGYVDVGSGQVPAKSTQWTGTMTAIHAESGKIAWQIHLPTPAIGGISSTGGGVIFFGLANGALEGVSAANGHIVWQKQVGAPIGMAPLRYTWKGNTYLALTTGGAESLASLFPWTGADHLVIFRLPRNP